MTTDNKDDKNVKTQFKGPGEWRSQAAKLEADRDKEPEKSPEK